MDLRIYDPKKCAVFCKTKDIHGGLSNMAGGFPIVINNVPILTSEALYQAMRFPDYPEIQERIINQRSPMTAKMIGKPFRDTHTRSDWNDVRVTLMRWCIRVKLLQNWKKFSEVLSDTDDLPIVELSTKGDDFWGAVIVQKIVEGKKKNKIQLKYPPSEEMPIGFLVGYNVLGRLNMELRQGIATGKDPMSQDFTKLEPLHIPNFRLYGEPIGEILRK